MNYNQILDIINQNIKRNEREEITGPVLNSVLRILLDFTNEGLINIRDVIQMLADSDANVLGSINPTTNTEPLPDGVYHAQIAGKYDNAGGIVVKEGYYTLLRKKDGQWSLEAEVEMPSASISGKIEVGQTTEGINGDTAIKYIQNKTIVPYDSAFASSVGYANRAIVYSSNGKTYQSNKDNNKDALTSASWTEIILNIPTGEVKEGEKRAVSGGEVYEKLQKTKIHKWTAKVYTTGEQVIHNDTWWEAVVNTTAAQEPGVASETIWKPKLNTLYKGVFNSVALALAGIPLASRKVGDTIGILGASGIEEYWWKATTSDVGLVRKSAYFEVADSSDILNIVDKDGNILATWGRDGKLESKYKDSSINNEALEKEIETFFKGSAVSTEHPSFLNLVADTSGNILGGWKRNGAFFANKIEAETIAGRVLEAVNEDITTSTFLAFDFPESVINVDLEGRSLPTSASEPRPKESMIATFRQGDNFLFRARVQVSIQGHGSANLLKKGYSLNFTNKDGKKLNIKWGRTHAVDSINMKAFHTDPTHARDITAGRMWHKIRTARPFPSSYIADFSNINTVNNKDYLYQDDALFYAEGFPVRLTHNGVFEGLYSWRMKKKRENYRMDGANKNNIFLDASKPTISYTAFDYTSWDLKSPKLSGYDEAGPIDDPVVLASINRFFDWTGACLAGTTDMRATFTDYLNLDSVIDYIITCELIGHWDANTNNTELMTWDGLRWSFCIYDSDQTMGVGWGSREVANKMVLTSSFWTKLKTVFAVELKARYTELRNSGLISMDTIYEEYSKIPAIIGADLYVENLAKWGWRIDDDSFTSVRDIIDFAQKKITYLDNNWKN